ncbi:unnamed protein product [Didymodactylos carnosus]|uniref:Uncharacterized protein n=1 Tax=Didymodactylos carnosus TaxID=1234261 RepID=A0A8S2NVN6_9BILA|nr:unnamed protein product [Didymodactylos carnosus]CAF4014258.1 unnamed protein product [Didymodactylos carnosus]
MAIAGVDQNTINVVKQLPERIKDAQALVSGDINRILERGILAGLPLNSIHYMTRNGVSLESATQLALDGMAIADADQKAINLVKQLPERIKDAQALLSGDINKMLERGVSAGLPLKAIQQIATKGFSAETATQLALEGITLAGVDLNRVNFIKKLPEQIKEAQALLNGDIDQILERDMLPGVPDNVIRQIFTNGVSIETATQLALKGMNAAGRGMSAGLPLNAVHQIATKGFSAEAATQLALEGMAIAGVDSNRVNFVGKLPEQIKDAQALLSGDFNEISKRGMLANVPVNAIRQIAAEGASVKAVTKIALTGMDIAGVNKTTLDFVKKLPEGIKNAEVLLNDDLEKMLRQNMSRSVDQLLGMFTEQSLFNGKEKEMFQLVRRRMPMVQDVINRNGQTVLSDALSTLGEHVSNLPLTDLLDIALPTAVQRVADRENKDIHDLFKTTIDQLQSSSTGFDEQTVRLINQILKSSDKWATFETIKTQLDINVRQLLSLVIERERQFKNDCDRLTNNSQAIDDYRRAFNVTFGTAQTRRADLKRKIERNVNSDCSLLKRAMIDFVDEVSNQRSGTRSPDVMKLLKEHFNESVVRPIAEKACERQMDENDTKLVDNFTKAITYVQKQQQQTQR